MRCGTSKRPLFAQPSAGFLDSDLEPTLPDDEDPPTGFLQSAYDLRVSASVLFDLFAPKALVRFRAFTSRAVVPVPKTPVYENYRLESLQHDIGRSGQRFLMEAIAISRSEQGLSDSHFRGRILIPNRTHDGRAGFFIEAICHQLLPESAKAT